MATLAKTARRLKLSTPNGWPRLFYMTDQARGGDPIRAVQRLPVGSGVIFRHYKAPDRAQIGAQVRAVCREQGHLFIVAGDARLARRLHADGLHLPENQLWRGPHRWQLWLDPHWIVTAAAHSERAVIRAAAHKCNGLLISPAFLTPSHPNARPLGVLRSQQMARRAAATRMAVFALGGIDPYKARRLGKCHISGFAGISAITR